MLFYYCLSLCSFIFLKLFYVNIGVHPTDWKVLNFVFTLFSANNTATGQSRPAQVTVLNSNKQTAKLKMTVFFFVFKQPLQSNILHSNAVQYAAASTNSIQH